VRQTIGAHRGRVSARNRPEGAEFRVFLPLDGGRAAETGAEDEGVDDATPVGWGARDVG
jgi:hypothetical protein